MLKELSPDLEGDEKTAGGQLIHIYPDIDSHEGIYMTIWKGATYTVSCK